MMSGNLADKILPHLVFLIPLILLACSSTTMNQGEHGDKETSTQIELAMQKFDKRCLTGDFDGDGNKDSLSQRNFSGLNKIEIDSSPDPFKNEWETCVKWFYDQKENTSLTFNETGKDTLNLGTCRGLYCLINLGDINQDNKDEIALVIDKCDFSRVNSCIIYSICNNKWKVLKQFSVHEDAFDFTENHQTSKIEINAYLIKDNGKWLYTDYSQNEFENEADVGKMRSLSVDKCE